MRAFRTRPGLTSLDSAVHQRSLYRLCPSSSSWRWFELTPGSGAYIGPVKMSMVVSVDPSGNRFSGVFSQTLYQASPTTGHEFDETAPVVTVTGTITARRMAP